jgi:hypothetical protein
MVTVVIDNQKNPKRCKNSYSFGNFGQSQKQITWAGGMIQAVRVLPSSCKVLSSNPSTAKKKKEKETNP